MYTRFFLHTFITGTLFLFAGLALGEGEENMVVDPEMGIVFRVPKGWKAQKQPEGYVLSSDALKGLIVIIPHDFDALTEMASAAREGIEDEESGTYLRLNSPIKYYGKNGIAGEFKGVFQSQTAKAYGIGLISSRGGGVIVLAAVDPESYSNVYPRLVQAIASSVAFIHAETDNSLMGYFAKTHYSRRDSPEFYRLRGTRT